MCLMRKARHYINEPASQTDELQESKRKGMKETSHLHHATLGAYKLGPVDQDVHQALEVQRVKLRVNPVRFPPVLEAFPSI